jgi:RimJ/RimL family protein N-acetyltransferase
MTPLRFPDPPLVDETVRLRPWTAADVPAKLMGFGDESVQRFVWPQTSDYTAADARAYFDAQEDARLRGEELNFAFVDPQDADAMLGGGSLYGVDLGQARAAVGYWLGPHTRGRGVASHAVRLLAGWAFDELGVARIELTCAPENEASQRVALRCGFVREGVLRSHIPFKGASRATVMFSLLPGELRR